jgi:hypothetical protein
MIDIYNALKALGMDNFVVNHDTKTEEEYKNSFRDETGKNRYIEWTDVQAKLTELQAEYKANQYQRDRKYPDLGEQFDLLFKDIDSGKVSKDGGFYKAIKAVKDAHPKPSE